MRLVFTLFVTAIALWSACTSRPTVSPDAQLDRNGPSDQPGDTAPVDSGGAPGWVRVHSGTFTMGSPYDELCREPTANLGIRETEHAVTLTHEILVSATETTRAQFEREMGYEPSLLKSCGSECPVDSVSWHEAAAYCNALSRRENRTPCYECAVDGPRTSCTVDAAYDSSTGKSIYDCPGYRLPTEAEWEYAYRAGSTTAFYSGPITVCQGRDPNLDRNAWYQANSEGTPHPVGSKAPNAWGLHDMAGNVGEWCHDWFRKVLGSEATTDPVEAYSLDGTKAVRQNDMESAPALARAAHRHFGAPTTQASVYGFRCVRSLTL